MEQTFEKTAEQAAAFQKMWAETASKIVQASFTFSPNSAPPEILRQIRSGIFQALAQSWDEFMRSPQFLEATRQWMDSAINFRKLTNDFLAKTRNDLQGPSREDIDTLMLNIRHMEKRLLDRVEALAAQVGRMNQRLGANGKGKAKTSRRAAGRAAAKAQKG